MLLPIPQTIEPEPLPPDVERIGTIARQQLAHALASPLLSPHCTPAHEMTWTIANGAYHILVKLETDDEVVIRVQSLNEQRERSRALNRHLALMEAIAREARLTAEPSPELARLLAQWREQELGEFEEEG